MQEEGAVGIFYERKYKEFSRVYGFAKIFLATGDTDVVRLISMETATTILIVPIRYSAP